MPQPSNHPLADYVYRRIHPYNWDARKGKLKRGAWVPKAGTQLSVFRSDLQTPRGLLQHCIDDWHHRLVSNDEGARLSAAENLSKYGGTVEELVHNGWRVAKLPVAAFLERGFTLDGPEANGHQNVEGDYALYSGEFVAIAETLTEEDCLA